MNVLEYKKRPIHNLVMLVMSDFHDHSREVTYHCPDGFCATGTQTNESPLKYIQWKLQQETNPPGQKIDKVYAFVTDKVEEKDENGKSSIDKFLALFPEPLPMETEKLADNGHLSGAMSSIIKMFDLVQAYQQQFPNDLIRVHMDMTGGPRHDSMLMIALLQMLKYKAHIQTGMVVYANYNKDNPDNSRIEVATELMDLFTLTTGAENFTEYGSVDQLQQYFSPASHSYTGTISTELNDLLQAMDDISGTIRVCGSYEIMEQALRHLRDKMAAYDTYMKNAKLSHGVQDLVFDKLLPEIRQTYNPIMPDTRERMTPADIINWCIERQFLQQALTFYTEWMPRYLLDKETGLIQIHNEDIIKECKGIGGGWESWEIGLFRKYPLKEKATKAALKKESSYRNLFNKCLRKYKTESRCAFYTLNEIQGKNKYLDQLLQCWNTLSQKGKDGWLSLPENSPLRRILEIHLMKNPRSLSYQSFIEHHGNDVGKMNREICKAIGSLDGNDKNEYIFYGPAPFQEEFSAASYERIHVIYRLLLYGELTAHHISAEQLLRFVGEYNEYVSTLRNNFNHAKSHYVSKEANAEIAHKIQDSVAFLCSSSLIKA